MPNDDKYQFNARNVFLTYPQCAIPLPQLLAFLWTRPNVVYACVSSEKHVDGQLHRHAFVQFSKPLRTRDPRYFDFEGCHPNVQGARNSESTLKYVKKEDDFLEKGSFVETRAGRKPKESMAATEIQEKAQSMTYAEFLCWASENKVMYAKDIWQAYAKKETTTLLADTGFSHNLLDPAFDMMMREQALHNHDWSKAVVLVGASGIGKTVLAKALIIKPALFVSHIDQLKGFRSGYHRGIVFDDVSFKHTPITNQIAICDFHNPRSIHCRHTIANIPAGIFKIFTCNEAPLELEHEAIARRTKVILCNHGHLNKYRDPISKKIN
jgi:hypothetical protein